MAKRRAAPETAEAGAELLPGLVDEVRVSRPEAVSGRSRRAPAVAPAVARTSPADPPLGPQKAVLAAASAEPAAPPPTRAARKAVARAEAAAEEAAADAPSGHAMQPGARKASPRKTLPAAVAEDAPPSPPKPASRPKETPAALAGAAPPPAKRASQAKPAPTTALVAEGGDDPDEALAVRPRAPKRAVGVELPKIPPGKGIQVNSGRMWRESERSVIIGFVERLSDGRWASWMLTRDGWAETGKHATHVDAMLAIPEPEVFPPRRGHEPGGEAADGQAAAGQRTPKAAPKGRGGSATAPEGARRKAADLGDKD